MNFSREIILAEIHAGLVREESGAERNGAANPVAFDPQPIEQGAVGKSPRQFKVKAVGEEDNPQPIEQGAVDKSPRQLKVKAVGEEDKPDELVIEAEARRDRIRERVRRDVELLQYWKI